MVAIYAKEDFEQARYEKQQLAAVKKNSRKRVFKILDNDLKWTLVQKKTQKKQKKPAGKCYNVLWTPPLPAALDAKTNTVPTTTLTSKPKMVTKKVSANLTFAQLSSLNIPNKPTPLVKAVVTEVIPNNVEPAVETVPSTVIPEPKAVIQVRKLGKYYKKRAQKMASIASAPVAASHVSPPPKTILDEPVAAMNEPVAELEIPVPQESRKPTPIVKVIKQKAVSAVKKNAPAPAKKPSKKSIVQYRIKISSPKIPTAPAKAKHAPVQEVPKENKPSSSTPIAPESVPKPDNPAKIVIPRQERDKLFMVKWFAELYSEDMKQLFYQNLKDRKQRKQEALEEKKILKSIVNANGSPSNLIKQIFVGVSGAPLIPIDITTVKTVEDLKQKINEKTKIQPSFQRLSFNRKKLENDKDLTVYGIKKDSIVYLNRPLLGGGLTSIFDKLNIKGGAASRIKDSSVESPAQVFISHIKTCTICGSEGCLTAKKLISKIPTASLQILADAKLNTRIISIAKHEYEIRQKITNSSTPQSSTHSVPSTESTASTSKAHIKKANVKPVKWILSSNGVEEISKTVSKLTIDKDEDKNCQVTNVHSCQQVLQQQKPLRPNEESFINACIHYIFSVPEFVTVVETCVPTNNNLASEMKNILHRYQQGFPPTAESYTNVSQMLGLRIPHKKGGQCQEDLNDIIFKILRYISIGIDRDLFKPSFVDQLLSGCTITTKQCLKCETSKTTEYEFSQMELSFNDCTTAEGAILAKFFKLKLDSSFRCQKCNDKTAATVQQSLKEVPKILKIKIARFEPNYTRRDDKMTFPNFLNFNMVVDGNFANPPSIADLRIPGSDACGWIDCNSSDSKIKTLMEQGKHVYELLALCNHVGDTVHGYYEIFYKRNDLWFKCVNDAVHQTSPSEVSASAATCYAMFYRKIDDELLDESESDAIFQMNDINAGGKREKVFAMTREEFQFISLQALIHEQAEASELKEDLNAFPSQILLPIFNNCYLNIYNNVALADVNFYERLLEDPNNGINEKLAETLINFDEQKTTRIIILLPYSFRHAVACFDYDRLELTFFNPYATEIHLDHNASLEPLEELKQNLEHLFNVQNILLKLGDIPDSLLQVNTTNDIFLGCAIVELLIKYNTLPDLEEFSLLNARKRFHVWWLQAIKFNTSCPDWIKFNGSLNIFDKIKNMHDGEPVDISIIIKFIKHEIQKYGKQKEIGTFDPAWFAHFDKYPVEIICQKFATNVTTSSSTIFFIVEINEFKVLYVYKKRTIVCWIPDSSVQTTTEWPARNNYIIACIKRIIRHLFYLTVENTQNYKIPANLQQDPDFIGDTGLYVIKYARMNITNERIDSTFDPKDILLELQYFFPQNFIDTSIIDKAISSSFGVQNFFQLLGFRIHIVVQDGSSFYRAILVSINQDEEGHADLRTATLNWIRDHPEDFDDIIANIDGYIATQSIPNMTIETAEILAVSELLQKSITIVQTGTDPIFVGVDNSQCEIILTRQNHNDDFLVHYDAVIADQIDGLQQLYIDNNDSDSDDSMAEGDNAIFQITEKRKIAEDEHRSIEQIERDIFSVNNVTASNLADCPICNKKFSPKSVMAAHLKICKAEKLQQLQAEKEEAETSEKDNDAPPSKTSKVDQQTVTLPTPKPSNKIHFSTRLSKNEELFIGMKQKDLRAYKKKDWMECPICNTNIQPGSTKLSRAKHVEHCIKEIESRKKTIAGRPYEIFPKKIPKSSPAKEQSHTPMQPPNTAPTSPAAPQTSENEIQNKVPPTPPTDEKENQIPLQANQIQTTNDSDIEMEADVEKENVNLPPSRIAIPNPIPLRNSSNYCFLNSIIQLLFSLLEFINHTSNYNPYHVQNDIVNVIQTLLQQFRNGDESAYTSELINFLNIPNEERHRHQDLPEHMLTILTQVSEKTATSEFNYIDAYHRGDTDATVTCQKCNMTSNTKDFFYILQLPLKYSPSKNQYSLEELLIRNLCKTDDIPNYYCNNCKENTPATKWDKYYLPQTLTIQLLRFDGTEKLHNRVTFPNYFNLSSLNDRDPDTPAPQIDDLRIIGCNDKDGWLLPSNEKVQLTSLDYNYELVGFANHDGEQNGGHYTSYVKRELHWYECNDANIRRVTMAKMKECSTSKVYVLLYRKMHLNASTNAVQELDTTLQQQIDSSSSNNSNSSSPKSPPTTNPTPEPQTRDNSCNGTNKRYDSPISRNPVEPSESDLYVSESDESDVSDVEEDNETAYDEKMKESYKVWKNVVVDDETPLTEVEKRKAGENLLQQIMDLHRTDDHVPHIVYALIDENGVIKYIGMTSDGVLRFKNHHRRMIGWKMKILASNLTAAGAHDLEALCIFVTKFREHRTTIKQNMGIFASTPEVFENVIKNRQHRNHKQLYGAVEGILMNPTTMSKTITPTARTDVAEFIITSITAGNEHIPVIDLTEDNEHSTKKQSLSMEFKLPENHVPSQINQSHEPTLLQKIKTIHHISDKHKPYYVYILVKNNTIIYIGMTSNPRMRLSKHKKTFGSAVEMLILFMELNLGAAMDIESLLIYNYMNEYQNIASGTWSSQIFTTILQQQQTSKSKKLVREITELFEYGYQNATKLNNRTFYIKKFCISCKLTAYHRQSLICNRCKTFFERNGRYPTPEEAKKMEERETRQCECCKYCERTDEKRWSVDKTDGKSRVCDRCRNFFRDNGRYPTPEEAKKMEERETRQCECCKYCERTDDKRKWSVDKTDGKSRVCNRCRLFFEHNGRYPTPEEVKQMIEKETRKCQCCKYCEKTGGKNWGIDKTDGISRVCDRCQTFYRRNGRYPNKDEIERWYAKRPWNKLTL